MATKKDKCWRGHDLSNGYLSMRNGKQSRQCRECHKINTKIYRNREPKPKEIKPELMSGKFQCESYNADTGKLCNSMNAEKTIASGIYMEPREMKICKLCQLRNINILPSVLISGSGIKYEKVEIDKAQ